MKVIVDASNVAHFKKDENSKPMLNNILAAVESLEAKGDEFVVIADASLAHDIDNPEEYNKLVADELIEEVPSGNNADHFILKLAEEENAKVLSNDKFRDFKDEFFNIDSIRIPFSFDGSRLVMGHSKKPKKDKNILQHICDDILDQFEAKRWDTYREKEGIELTPLNIAKESIIKLDDAEHHGLDNKIEGVLSKIPMFKEVVSMVDGVETQAPHIIFVLVHPRDYKVTVRNAGPISNAIAERLRLPKKPLIAVRNDLFTKPGTFNLNALYNEEVMDYSPFNVEIHIDNFDEIFIKKNSRNIASTIASRTGSWKFPFVTVKPDIMLEKPGDFEIFLEKGGNKDEDSLF
ncbi:Zc3h12a-like ribonuclease [Methanobrevibacter sp. 87.7]|uniref:NYN domain-containing protein n=1 Tax=Methanobrevibacter sp. 87.7 TaxID=387957 RepID=UPI000B511BA8|nr:Zc3h12a-like ribonuclease [Methanobrevibacter sp. 87.7]OWT32604.1 Zc3h12a-like ribonuclease [Methanobrevibacter sp. 87.7]